MQPDGCLPGGIHPGQVALPIFFRRTFGSCETHKNTMKTKPIIASLSLIIALAFGAFQSMTWAADKSGMDANDVKFIKKTSDSGMAELKLATLGTQKAERADVKEFANMLVSDHNKSNEELASLAKTKGVEVSAMIPAKGADAFKDLENESGKNFDKAFLDKMEKDHKACIDDFEDAEKNAKDGDLKAWVSKTLPTLRAHLDKVKELKGK
jgi:putative membrane protein